MTANNIAVFSRFGGKMLTNEEIVSLYIPGYITKISDDCGIVSLHCRKTKHDWIINIENLHILHRHASYKPYHMQKTALNINAAIRYILWHDERVYQKITKNISKSKKMVEAIKPLP